MTLQSGCAALSLLALCSCFEAGPPPDVLDTETFARVYVALVESGRATWPKRAIHIGRFEPDTTLARFGVTRDQLEGTIEYCNEDLERWKEVYLMVAKLQEDQNHQAEQSP